MTETIETVTIRGEAITASLLVWRRFKAPMPGVVERLYDINPGLAELGPHLPINTVVRLPVPAPRPDPLLTPLRLWD